MGMKLGAATEFFSPGLDLTLPDRHGAEREYKVPLASAELGLWCRLIATARDRLDIDEADLPKLPGDGKKTLAQQVLGTAYDQMRADGVPDPYIEFATQTAFIWIAFGEEQAEAYWKAGGDPKALMGNRADRRAAERAGGTSTGADGSTPPPASTSGTTSRPRSGRRSRRR